MNEAVLAGIESVLEAQGVRPRVIETCLPAINEVLESHAQLEQWADGQ